MLLPNTLDVYNLFPTTESNHNKIHAMYKEDKEGTQRLLLDMLDRYRREYSIPPSL